MRVGLNGTCLGPRPSGATQRFAGLYRALIRQCPDVDFIIYEPADWSLAQLVGAPPNVEFRKTPLPSNHSIGRFARGLQYWPQAFARDRLDLFETFHLPLVRALKCPTILTIHDVRHVLSSSSPIRRMLNLRITEHALRRADRVITVSDTMAAELRAIEPDADVTTIYNGIDPAAFGDQAAATQLLPRLALPSHFLLAVGHFEPRKNYERLLKTLAELRRQRADLALVIVGRDGGSLGETMTERDRLGLGDAVSFRTEVDDAELAAMYRAAELVVFPSTYEGFGIPILEAMAAERPLAVSDIPVFRELTEAQGVYFDPTDSAAMATTIGALLDDPARQAQLIAYGRRRIEAFGFGQLAERLEALYREIMARPPSPGA